MAKRNINHVEIPSRDLEESSKFYQQLFDWKITPIPELNYTVWESGESSRGGFAALSENVKAGDVQVYVESQDIEADLKNAKSLGAIILQGKKEIPAGWFGVFKDPTGNKIGLFTRKLNR